MVDLMERRVALRARRRALLNQLREDQIAAQTRRQMGGCATADQARLDDQASRRAARQLRRLQAALGRVADGSYGICMQCGGRISAQRLDEDPSTTLCASCKGEG
ncbi:TraR/DksA C4-type zinc finger protein [Dinoroseobacter sp. S76]|uniref:TraR/DksA C4-type zinc finger protein n=1 Tax=Dinoroseobacter sp. S76 TaxID=3415124 RepID=UPI003C798FC8